MHWIDNSCVRACLSHVIVSFCTRTCVRWRSENVHTGVNFIEKAESSATVRFVRITYVRQAGDDATSSDPVHVRSPSPTARLSTASYHPPAGLSYRTFVPAAVKVGMCSGAPEYESFTATWERAKAWLKCIGMRDNLRWHFAWIANHCTGFVFRPHRLHAVGKCGLLLQMSHVTWSVCMSVRWSHGCAMQKRPNRSRCRFKCLAHVGPRNHVLDEGPDAAWEGSLLRGHVAVHLNVPTASERACSGDAAFCQIT